MSDLDETSLPTKLLHACADAYGALRVLEASSLAAAQPTVTLTCLHGAEAVARVETESSTVDLATSNQDPNTDRANANQALCTVQLENLHSCQLLCSMVLELLAHCLKIMPHAVLPWISPETLPYVTDCIVHAGFSVQAAALSTMAALLPELEYELIPVHAVCAALLTALEACVSSGTITVDHPAAHPWQRHMTSCLNLLAGFMDGSDSEAGAAERMLAMLTRCACNVPSTMTGLQAQICKLVVHVARQYPQLRHHVVGLLPLLSDSGQTGSAVSMALQLLLQQLGPAHLDAAFAASQVSHLIHQCCAMTAPDSQLPKSVSAAHMQMTDPPHSSSPCAAGNS